MDLCLLEGHKSSYQISNHRLRKVYADIFERRIFLLSILSYLVRTLYISGEEYASSLTICLGFYDEGLSFSCLTIIVIFFEILVVVGKHPGVGEEIVLFRKFLSKCHKIFAKIIFSGENFHPREMINFLPLTHLVEDILFDMVIGPAKIEIHAGDRISNKCPF